MCLFLDINNLGKNIIKHDMGKDQTVRFRFYNYISLDEHFNPIVDFL